MVDSNLPPDIPSLLKGIEELRPLLEKNAAQGETDRRVAQESIDALEAIGAFRVTQPAKYGGYQGDSRAQIDVGAAVGRADGGTAWVVALTNIANWLTSLYDAQAQEDVWGEDPNAKVSVVLATNGRTTRVDGGYRVSARKAFASGTTRASYRSLISAACRSEDSSRSPAETGV